MNRNLKHVVVISLLALIFSSCSSNSPNSPEDQNKPPAIPSTSNLKVTVPQNAPAELQLGAQTANALLTFGLNTWLNSIANTQPSGGNGNWQWTVTAQGITVTLKAVEGSDGSVSWTLTLNGTDPQTGDTYNNWVAMTGTTSADGKSGSFTIYEENSTTVAVTATWSTNEAGTTTVTIETPDGDSWAITSNADGSGTMVIKENGKKTYEASWNSASAGTWTSYNPETGEQTGSGSWS